MLKQWLKTVRCLAKDSNRVLAASHVGYTPRILPSNKRKEAYLLRRAEGRLQQVLQFVLRTALTLLGMLQQYSERFHVTSGGGFAVGVNSPYRSLRGFER
jgi:hypothetical protein